MLKILLAPSFVRQYARLSAIDQRLCDTAVDSLPLAFGNPHHHAGRGIRALRRRVYECRASQSVRILFTLHGETLLLQAIGNHDTIRAWLRNIR